MNMGLILLCQMLVHLTPPAGIFKLGRCEGSWL